MARVGLILFLWLTTVFLFGQSQSQLLKDFSATALHPASVSNDKLTIKTKVWPVKLEWSGDDVSKIVLLRAGVLEEIHEPNIPGYPSYFFNASNRLCYINGVFVYYSMSSNDIVISYILSPDPETFAAIDVKTLRNKMKDYFLQLSSQQNTAREEYKSGLNAEKEKEKLANSIKGKEIRTMEIVWLTKSYEIGMQSQIYFGVKATDVNGKIFSTDNIGGKTSWDDFEVTATGAVPGDGSLTVDTDASKIPGNKATVKVKSKFHTNLFATSSIDISFGTPVKLAYKGKDGCPPLTSGTGTSGGRASFVELNVCNSADGKYVLIEVLVDGASYHKLKLMKGIAFTLDTRGGPGCSGRPNSGGQGGRGGNGGAGGMVVINKDPSTVGDNIIIYNSGGKGGNGGDGAIKGVSGRDGDDGSVVRNSKNVVLNF